jgi:hypothetical protein
MVACNLTDTNMDTINKGFIRRWNLQNQRKLIQMVGLVHSDICNVAKHLLPGFRVQVKMTKSRREFYLMNKDDSSKVVFKFQDAKLFVKRVKPNPA